MGWGLLAGAVALPPGGDGSSGCCGGETLPLLLLGFGTCCGTTISTPVGFGLAVATFVMGLPDGMLDGLEVVGVTFIEVPGIFCGLDAGKFLFLPLFDPPFILKSAPWCNC